MSIKDNKIVSSVTGTLGHVKTYWNKPPIGQHISYKEIGFLSGAGFGAHWSTLLASAIGLDAANMIVGTAIGFKPTDLQYMLIIANLIGMPLGIFRAWYYDNHRMKGGKFLPFIQRTVVPIFLISVAMVWIPYERIDYTARMIVVELMYILLNIFLCFYMESYTYFQQIISPDSNERAKVLSISQVFYSFAPTLTNLFIPILASLTGGLTSIRTYRIIYPIFGVIGVVLSLVFFGKVKERLILPKKKADPVRLIDAIREVAKNKYFWITQSASWVVFLESGYVVILLWQFIYKDGGIHEPTYGLAITIVSNASLWSMLLAPYAISRFGKRNMLIFINTFNAIAIFALYFTYKNLILICVIWYLNSFASTFWNIIQHNISADMRDYHQWKTGVRIDGMFSVVGLVGTFIGFATGLFYPFIYEMNGVFEDKSVLYNDAVRYGLFEDLIIFSVIGAILNLLPFFFYDLSENKHRAYADVLRIRKMFSDNVTGELDDDNLIEAMATIREAQSLADEVQTPVDKTPLRDAKALPKSTKEEKQLRKEAIARAKAQMKAAKERNLAIERAPIILEDLKKFSTEAGRLRVAAAEKVLSGNKLSTYDNVREELRLARALPKATKAEKEIRADAIKLAKAKKEATALIKKYGKENIHEPVAEEKQIILEKETPNFIAAIAVKRELSRYAKRESVYRRAVKPYAEAMELIETSINYDCFDELEARYLELVGERA